MSPLKESYPAYVDGPLCPLLNNGELMLRFYESSGTKPNMKKFIKRHTWPGKPPLSYSVGPETMKKMLLHANGSAPARAVLYETTAKLENSPVLYQVIWNWLSLTDPNLIRAVDNFSHTVNELVFISPDELRGLMESQVSSEEWSEDRKVHLVYLVLAFAMLQPNESIALLRTLTERFPEMAGPVGLAV